MTYTRHGHHIPGTRTDDEQGQVSRARCGGVAICTMCQSDAAKVIANQEGVAIYDLLPEDLPFPEDISEYSQDPDRFLKRAKLYVVGSWNNQISEGDVEAGKELAVDNLYIVWFTYILGGWKAMISTNIPGDGLYFEVTHNAQKNETYVDTYQKLANDKFSEDGGEKDAVSDQTP